MGPHKWVDHFILGLDEAYTQVLRTLISYVSQIMASSGECTYKGVYSPDDTLIVRNIHRFSYCVFREHSQVSQL